MHSDGLQMEPQKPMKHEPEPAIDPERAAKLVKMARYMKGELRRHYLSERERLVADQVVEVTLCNGRDRIRVPKLEVLSDLTGLERSHIHTALRSLHEMRIILTSHKEAALVLTINLDSENWKVKPRVPRATVMRGLEVLDEFNRLGQYALSQAPGENPENFRVEDPAQILLSFVPNSGNVPDFPTTL